MDKSIVKSIIKSAIIGAAWVVALVICASGITLYTDYLFKDVLFVEAIVFVMAGIASSIGGNPMGLSLQGLGSQNAQYMSQANLEITKMEREKLGIKTTMSIGFNTVSLLTGGIVSMIISFII